MYFEKTECVEENKLFTLNERHVISKEVLSKISSLHRNKKDVKVIDFFFLLNLLEKHL